MISSFGSCQSHEVTLLLLRSSSFRNRWGTDYFNAMKQPLERIREAFTCTDLLIHQPISDRHAPRCTSTFLPWLPAGARDLSFPYIFNDGLWGIEVPGAANDAVWGDFDLCLVQDPRTRFAHNLAITRAKESSTTVKLSTFIVSRYREQELFYTQNHPTILLLHEVARQLLAELRLPDDLDLCGYAPTYGASRWPVTKAALDAFNFRFELKNEVLA